MSIKGRCMCTTRFVSNKIQSGAYMAMCSEKGVYAYMTERVMTTYRGICECAYTVDRGGCGNVHPI